MSCGMALPSFIHPSIHHSSSSTLWFMHYSRLIRVASHPCTGTSTPNEEGRKIATEFGLNADTLHCAYVSSGCGAAAWNVTCCIFKLIFSFILFLINSFDFILIIKKIFRINLLKISTDSV